MRYTAETVEKADREMENRRNRSEQELFVRRSEVFRKYPDAKAIDDKIASASREFIRIMTVRDRDERQRQLDALQRDNLAQQQLLREFLSARGYEEDYLEPRYVCPLCRDTGTRNGRTCSCYTELLRQIAYRELCEASPLDLCSFEDFDLNYYPDDDGQGGMSSRAIMKSIYDYCRMYAEDFSRESPNLLMYGGTGLGKTHLSLSIAGEIVGRGFGVVYDSCPNMVKKLTDEQFGRGAEGTEESLLDCDLLIIDDLGAEFSTQVTVPALYNIINTRLLRRMPTIISTNLDMSGIQNTYTERIASRIIGEYTLLKFAGKDVRQIRK